MHTVNITGQSFGRLTAKHRTVTGKRAKWLCVCICGNTKEARQDHLIAGVSTSCGCFRVDNTIKMHTTHGQSRSTTYRSWSSMMTRCYDQKQKEFKYWGGRGIKVCDQWHKFECFFEDMGQRPEGCTIDRYPNKNGNYEPGNCRWATAEEQANNVSSNLVINLNGDSRTLAQWSRATGIKAATIRERVVRGHPPDKALQAEGFLKRGSRLFEYQGRKQRAQQWADEFGILVQSFLSRMRRGRSIHEALTDTPWKHHKNNLIQKQKHVI